MKRQLKMSLAICAVTAAALWSAGCAKQQVVKPDQALSAAATTAPAAPVKAPVVAEKKSEVKDIGLPSGEIKESPAQKSAEATATSGAALAAALDKVFFDFDSSALSAQARETLTKNAEMLKKDGKVKVRIEGHCDEAGSDDYNLALGERRAKAAVDYLRALGVSSDRLSTISYGKEKPADPGHDEAARARNRRDEFVMTAN